MYDSHETQMYDSNKHFFIREMNGVTDSEKIVRNRLHIVTIT